MKHNERSRLLGPDSMPVAAEQPAQQINVMPKADIKMALVQFTGEISRWRSEALQVAGRLASMREQVVFTQAAIERMSLIGGHIDRDILAGPKEIERLSAAIEGFAELIEYLGDLSHRDVFDAPALLREK